MRPPVTIAAFVAVLAVLFGGGALAGDLIGPDRGGTEAPAVAPDGHDGMTSMPGTGTEDAGGVRGLAVSEGGLRLRIDDPELTRGTPHVVRFRIVDERGRTVRDFEVAHERRMHLIVARRDLATFQHLHPAQAGDGSWSAEVTLAEAGSYRLFADFARGGAPHTLAGDLRVDGDADLRPLPAPSPAAVSDGGYDVRLDADDARPGVESALRFTITRDGRPVHTQPYLGAGGHLVILREGDLGFLHVHPSEHGDEASEHDAEPVAFAATFPTAGSYRLFLQFRHEGRVQTVAFTREIG